jgi:Tfp pilus assembly protein PilF
MAATQDHPLLRDRAAGLSPAATQLLDEAAAALTRNALDAAETSLLGVLAQAPNCVEAKRLRGLLMQLRGDYAQAATILRQALALSPDNALIHMNLGTTLHSLGKPEAALASLQRASKLAGDFAPAWFNLGRMFSILGRPVGAVTALHRALDIDPDHLPARIVLAEAQTRLGKMDQAATNYREVLRRHPGHPDAWMGLANLQTAGFDQHDVARLQHALQVPQTPVNARVSLGFALARVLEGKGDYHEAFRALSKANALKRRMGHWDAAVARSHIDTMLDVFATPMHEAQDATLGEAVIFTVSLPQGGTDPATQILAAHPLVGAVESSTYLPQVIDDESARRGQPFSQWARAATAEDWARLGQDYLSRTAPAHRDKPRFVDANPFHWPLLGAALAMLPGARVVIRRGDVLETCLTCYRQLFASGHEFSYDLDHIASYWRDYDRLVRHWRRLYPQRVMELSDALLQDDAKAQVRRLLAFCNLDPDPACLAFDPAPQMPRSALYGSELNHLRVLLGAA